MIFSLSELTSSLRAPFSFLRSVKATTNFLAKGSCNSKLDTVLEISRRISSSELESLNRGELGAWIDQERQTRVDAEQRQLFLKEFWPVFLGVALLLVFSGVIGVRCLRTIRANKALAQKQMSVTAVHTRDEAA